MTKEKAISILKTDSCYECTWGCVNAAECVNSECNLKKAVDMAIKALEKQISKKPDRTSRPYKCPTCGSVASITAIDLPPYCCMCGTKLDWSDSND